MSDDVIGSRKLAWLGHVQVQMRGAVTPLSYFFVWAGKRAPQAYNRLARRTGGVRPYQLELHLSDGRSRGKGDLQGSELVDAAEDCAEVGSGFWVRRSQWSHDYMLLTARGAMSARPIKRLPEGARERDTRVLYTHEQKARAQRRDGCGRR